MYMYVPVVTRFAQLFHDELGHFTLWQPKFENSANNLPAWNFIEKWERFAQAALNCDRVLYRLENVTNASLWCNFCSVRWKCH